MNANAVIDALWALDYEDESSFLIKRHLWDYFLSNIKPLNQEAVMTFYLPPPPRIPTEKNIIEVVFDSEYFILPVQVLTEGCELFSKIEAPFNTIEVYNLGKVDSDTYALNVDSLDFIQLNSRNGKGDMRSNYAQFCIYID
jgi:hypothetical protein